MKSAIVVDVPDLAEHLEHRLVGAAVGGAPQAGDAGGDAGERVGAGGAGQAHGAGGRVLLVVGVQDEDAVHRAGEDRVHLVVLAGHRVHHVQEVLRVVEVVPGVHERLADGVLVGPGGDGGQLGDQPEGADAALLGVVDVEAVMVERRQRADHAADDRHRVRVAAEAVVEGAELLVDHRVMDHALLELDALRVGRQLAVEQEKGDLQEGRLLGQLLDRVAAVQQHALVAVDVGDLAVAGGGGAVAGVVGEHPEVAVQLADVGDLGADGAGDQRQLGRSVGSVQRDRQRTGRDTVHACNSWGEP